MKISNKFLLVTLLIVCAIIFAAVPQIVSAQSTYKLVQSPDVSVKVLGSSNVHEWSLTATVLESQGSFTFNGGNLEGLHAFNFQLAVKSLKSEHASMDDRTYKAVNAAKYPDITYKLTSAVVSLVQKGKYLIKTKGDLTISGATQAISMDVTAVVGDDNVITVSGSKKIQLTEYSIKPPTFMLGAMKVYNDLNIQFNLIYKKQS